MVRELEVKVLGINIDDMKNRILELGGELVAKEKQVNTLIDSTTHPIKSYMDAYLRIRESHDLLKDTFTDTFTLKKNLENKKIRENEEYNVLVDDKDALLSIMENLGFDKISIGYKYRESYALLGARIDLDQWDKDTYPYPYMEIEVSDEKDLEIILEKLNIDNNSVSRLSIVELQDKLRKGQEGKNA